MGHRNLLRQLTRRVQTVPNEAYRAIKSKGVLPAPDGRVLELIRLADDERSEIADIVALVESEPTIASRLLRYANSPSTSFPRQIKSVSQAVVLLGMNAVKSIALGFWLLSYESKGLCAKFNYQAFRSEAVARAVTMRHVAHRLKAVAADEAFTCGLLSQVGRLAFAAAYPETYAQVLAFVDADDPRQLLGLEREAFDISHNDVAAEMMGDWRLPAAFCDAVRFQDSPDAGRLRPGSLAHQLARMLNLAGDLSNLLTRPRANRTFLTRAIISANRLGIKPDTFGHAFDSMSGEWQTMGDLLDVATRPVPPLVVLYSQAISS